MVTIFPKAHAKIRLSGSPPYFLGFFGSWFPIRDQIDILEVKGRSPNHWTAKEVVSPSYVIFLKDFFIWTILKIFIEFVYSIVSCFNFFWGVLGHVGS